MIENYIKHKADLNAAKCITDSCYNVMLHLISPNVRVIYRVGIEVIKIQNTHLQLAPLHMRQGKSYYEKAGCSNLFRAG